VRNFLILLCALIATGPASAQSWPRFSTMYTCAIWTEMRLKKESTDLENWVTQLQQIEYVTLITGIKIKEPQRVCWEALRLFVQCRHRGAVGGNYPAPLRKVLRKWSTAHTQFWGGGVISMRRLTYASLKLTWHLQYL